MDRRFVTSEEFANLYGYKKSTVTVWRCTNRFPKLISRVGGRLYVDLEEWERLLRVGLNKKPVKKSHKEKEE